MDNRAYVSTVMERADEGLAGWAYRALLQIGDADPGLDPRHAAKLWDQPMGDPLVEWQGIQAGYALTPFGQRLYDAANAGDARTIIRLTTDPTFGEWVN